MLGRLAGVTAPETVSRQCSSLALLPGSRHVVHVWFPQLQPLGDTPPWGGGVSPEVEHPDIRYVVYPV